ncbi:MAG TPA: 2OG-Fe(II) oxygenase, partial [Accumulibacter sp.]|nr:2OG-Fe(II) oxygenase [Accumulibacter sp.]
SLPLLPAQAEDLIAVAEQAPNGRGAETLVDTAVRKTWQIAADRIHLGGRHWAPDLARIVERSAVGLGVLEPVTAELYKMLVYDAGSFFVSHRDTEKAPGMFATLIIVLPSVFTGGELCIRHREREVCLDLAPADPAELAFAAFYADCLHEVRPVTSGCRLVLVYNLIRLAGGELPRPPTYEAEVDRVVELLERWVAQQSMAEAADCPRKLIYPLEHVYSAAEMCFSTLKLADAAAAAVLMAAARRADCQLHLAFLTIDESGAAEYADFSPPGRRRYYEEEEEYEDDFEAGEVFERILTLSDWQNAEGGPSLIDSLPGDDDEICPPQALDDAEPDEEEFSEATGNAGASFERRYRRAALVVWPRAGEIGFIAAAGRAVSQPYLDRLTQRCVAEAPETRPLLLDQAHALTRLMIDRRNDWPITTWMRSGEPGPGGELLTSLCRIGATDDIVVCITEISAHGCYCGADNPTLCEALMSLSPVQAADLARQVIAGSAVRQADACADLLARLATAFVERLPVNEAADRLRPAVQALLVATLPDEAVPAVPTAPGYGVSVSSDRTVTSALLVDLLQALCRLADPALGEQAIDLVLARPGRFSFDALLIPAALSLAGAGDAVRVWPPVRRLNSACLTYLAQRIAEPLIPPADFIRESRIDCACAHCRELAVFLADPQRREWIFKAAQTHRSHVENSIRRHQCDLDYDTVRRGNPHSLVCRKNQASFKRRVAQRQQDLAAHERLSQAAGE